MLDKTTSYHVPTLMQPRVKTVTGRYLAHGKLSKPERAVLAADLHDGTAVLGRLTIAQLARLAGVSDTYVRAAIAASPERRRRVKAGEVPLVAPPPVRRTLPLPAPAISFAASSDDQVVNLVREIGVGRTWDAIAKIID
jgi:hypothetical protein